MQYASNEAATTVQHDALTHALQHIVLEPAQQRINDHKCAEYCNKEAERLACLDSLNDLAQQQRLHKRGAGADYAKCERECEWTTLREQVWKKLPEGSAWATG